MPHFTDYLRFQRKHNETEYRFLKQNKEDWQRQGETRPGPHFCSHIPGGPAEGDTSASSCVCQTEGTRPAREAKLGLLLGLGKVIVTGDPDNSRFGVTLEAS